MFIQEAGGGGMGRKGNEFFDIPNDDMCQYEPLYSCSLYETQVLSFHVLVFVC